MSKPRFGGALFWSAVASLLSGLGALGFLTVGRFAVGLEGFAPMAHVWTVWSMAAATVAFGSQIETVQGLAENRGAFSRHHVRIAIVGAAAAGTLTYVWRVDLFGTDSVFWPLVCAVIPFGSLGTGVARGKLAAQDKRRSLALVISGENVVRFVGAGLVWWLGGDARALAIVLLLGFSVALVGLTGSHAQPGGVAVSRAAGGGAGAFAGLVAHACLVLPPSVLALQGVEPEVVAAIFLVLTYIRAPYQFLLGLGPVLTAEVFARQPDSRISWIGEGRRLVAIALATMVLAAAAAFVAGDLVSRLLLETTDILSRLDYALLSALVVAVSFAIVRTLHVLARGGRRIAMMAWATAALVATVGALVSATPTTLFMMLLAGAALCLLELTVLAPYRLS